MTIRTLDYKPRFDERSKNFAASDLIGVTDRIYRYWNPSRTVLDQGSEGACVGFAWTTALMCAPHKIQPKKPNKQGQGTYELARYVDYWEGEDYEGTSVLAGAKVLQELGFISEYRWCFNVQEVIDAILHIGPVVIGIPWFEGMYETGPNGLVHLGGKLAGGHAICLYAYNSRRDFIGAPSQTVVYWRNTWGTEYGSNGTGYITVSDLAILLAQEGEACVPIS